jgi:4-diphosphocytidyl-2-C-methyl-D-erythritol kinase
VRDMGRVGPGWGTGSLRPHGPERDTENRGAREFFIRIAADLSVLSVPAPAKINLFLAVTGRRADGFHDLVSVAAPLTWGDSISVETGGRQSFRSTCDAEGIPTDGTNLVSGRRRRLRRRRGWAGRRPIRDREAHPRRGWPRGGRAATRRRPHGAQRAGRRAPRRRRGFRAGRPRSARTAPCSFPGGPSSCAEGGSAWSPSEGGVPRIRGRRILVFKPGFAIPTAWAYGRLAASDGGYASGVLGRGHALPRGSKPGTPRRGPPVQFDGASGVRQVPGDTHPP